MYGLVVRGLSPPKEEPTNQPTIQRNRFDGSLFPALSVYYALKMYHQPSNFLSHILHVNFLVLRIQFVRPIKLAFRPTFLPTFRISMPRLF
jgi:hypothetical protein